MIRSFVALCSLLSATTAFAAATSLHSPWDAHPVKQTNVPYTCPALAHLAPDLTTDGFYRLDDPTHSIVDPVRMAAYKASADPVKELGLSIVKAGDAYRMTGSRVAAACVTNQVIALANDKALTGVMSSSQSYYVQGWVGGAIAIAYLKVRDAHLASPQQQNAIDAWLLKIGEATKGFYDRHAEKQADGNNHLYWAGVELAAIAVVANDQKDFQWALAAYDNGVNQIQPDGTLPLEMARGTRALHYHLYALAPLVLIAEFGEANGLDLYAHNHGAIHRLVQTSIHGLSDSSLFAQRTGIRQEAPQTISGDQIGWAPPYNRRFPDANVTRLIAAAPSLSVYYLGGLPPQ